MRCKLVAAQPSPEADEIPPELLPAPAELESGGEDEDEAEGELDDDAVYADLMAPELVPEEGEEEHQAHTKSQT